MDTIKETFIDVLGSPYKSEYLDRYISFVLSNSLSDSDEYFEYHHIFPRSLFNIDTVVKLKYADHVLAHRLLVDAYPIREFIRPLNFMLSRTDKLDIDYRKLISISAKLSWKKFKETPNYITWKNKRSIYMSQYMKNGGSKYLSDLRFSNQKNRDNVAIQFKELWQQKEYRAKIILAMKLERNSSEGKLRMSKSATKRWNKMTEQQRIDFSQKMLYINSNEEKRKDASEKIKAKWQDEEFKDKMSKRKTRGSDGSALAKRWADPIFREKMLLSRKKHETDKG